MYMGFIHFKPGHVHSHLFQIFKRDIHAPHIDHARAHRIFRIISRGSLRSVVPSLVLIQDLGDGRAAVGHTGHGRRCYRHIIPDRQKITFLSQLIRRTACLEIDIPGLRLCPAHDPDIHIEHLVKIRLDHLSCPIHGRIGHYNAGIFCPCIDSASALPLSQAGEHIRLRVVILCCLVLSRDGDPDIRF